MGDMLYLLLNVLPTFIAITEKEQRDSRKASTSEEDYIRNPGKFYSQFISLILLLHSILFAYRDAIEEYRDRSPTKAGKVEQSLRQILIELEYRFVSRKHENFEHSGLQCDGYKTYPKLRALREKLSENTLGEEPSKAINGIIRIYSNHSGERKKLLGNLTTAQDFFINLLPPKHEWDSPCPMGFSDYPFVHFWNLTKTLFDTIERNWRLCKESDCTSHAIRKTRLHLTKHQRFETCAGSVSLNSKEQFRILFLINHWDFTWQSTEITATNLDYAKKRVKVWHEPMESGLCKIIQGVKPDIRPHMAIYGRKLWNLRSRTALDTRRNQSPSPTQHLNRHFKTLKHLLSPRENDRESSLSSMEARDCLILSFVLTASFLRLFRGPWLQNRFCSDNICFLVSDGAMPNITEPYLTTDCSDSVKSGPPSIDLAQPHPFPDILSLGILLLEICRGNIIDIPHPEVPCDVALLQMEAWTRPQAGRLEPIYNYLHKAISACISPDKLLNDGLDDMDVNEKKVRKYISERILWPLESALDDAFNIKPATLNADIATAEAPDGLGSFDHECEESRKKREAAKNWQHSLDSVHGLLDFYQKRSRKAPQGEVPVKVAVLDTGLQIPHEKLQNAYKTDGRISMKQSEDFVTSRVKDSICGWEIDRDGHGSRVGEIVLQVAPRAVLHVAKVFRHRDDLSDPKMSAQVHKQIAEASSFDKVEAIERASEVWKVDIIVMCFGFDKPISSIGKVIEKVSMIDSPPLLFAATRNDGANKDMAWPAKDSRVIGISSTDGYGVKSEFNPKEHTTSHPVLHAFGEAVPVSTANHGGKEYVSGTSYATPVAAALVANLLGCVRMIVATSGDNSEGYFRTPERLRKTRAMYAVLKEHMEKEHNNGDRSILPWDFLNIDNKRILEDVEKTLESILGRE